jgi:hypothetical protein
VALKVGDLYYDVTLDTKGLIAGEREAKRRIDGVGREFDNLQTRVTKVAAAIGAALAAIAIEGVVSKIISAQRSFDVMFASLKTMTGGADQASAAWERLTKFAAQTPFSLEQSVKGFVKLKALGLDPSERAMTSFGNTASAMGKSLEQMIEAVADASTSQFQRLLDFGIKAKQEGDRVSLTFRGVTTNIGNNAAEITEYLTRIGEVDFAGAMVERMKTLDGDISNLQDSLSGLYLSISQSGFGEAIAAGVRMATEAIQEASQSVKEGGLTGYFDGLRPVVQGAQLAVVTLAGAIAGRLIASMVAAVAKAYATAVAMGAATVAARGFGAVVAALGGPIGIAITALALLALNWDKVAGEARDAATISEQAAERIAAALKRSPGRATAELGAQLRDVQDELRLIDRELARTGANLAKPEELQELRARRDTLLKVAADINKAADSLHGGAGRGRLTPELIPLEKLEGGSPTPPKEKHKRTTDAVGDAEMDFQSRLDAWWRANEEAIDAAEEMEEKLAEKRRGEMMEEAEETRQLIEENGRKEADAKLRAVEYAAQLTQAVNPIDALRQEYEAKLGIVTQYEQLMAQAGVDATEQGQLARNEISREYELQRTALAEQSFRAQSDGNAFLIDSLNAMSTTATGAIVGLINGTMTATDVMRGLANVVLNEAVSSLVQIGVQQIKNALVGQTIEAAERARAAASGAVYTASVAAQVAGMSALAAQNAFAATAAIPIIGPALAPAAAAAAGAAAAAIGAPAIATAPLAGARQYGGPASAGSLYRVNETGRPEMFTAANGSQFMLPTQGGRVTAADQVGGGAKVEVRVHNYAGADVQVAPSHDGRVIDIAVRRAKAEIASEISSNTGDVWRSLRGASNLEPKL